jgi:glucans biosynthesis protein
MIRCRQQQEALMEETVGSAISNDPARRADIERRLKNMAKAPRCGAKTRSGTPCRQAAVRGRSRCRMHGGARGSGGPPGRRNGNFKHGIYTRENIAERHLASRLIRDVKRRLKTIRRDGG